jgi:hypothetical protein
VSTTKAGALQAPPPRPRFALPGASPSTVSSWARRTGFTPMNRFPWPTAATVITFVRRLAIRRGCRPGGADLVGDGPRSRPAAAGRARFRSWCPAVEPDWWVQLVRQECQMDGGSVWSHDQFPAG